MSRLAQIGTAVSVLAVVIALFLTSIPAVPLHGNRLLLHMMLSGALVVLLPIFAVSWLAFVVNDPKSNLKVRIGYWGMVVLGFVTIATMFLSMLPIAGTDDLHTLIKMHGYAGLAMVVAAVGFAFGWVRSRKNAMR